MTMPPAKDRTPGLPQRMVASRAMPEDMLLVPGKEEYKTANAAAAVALDLFRTKQTRTRMRTCLQSGAISLRCRPS